MLYCVPIRIRATDNGSGMIIDLEWYERDPEEEPRQSAFLIDQTLIPAATEAQITPEMIDAAIERRRPFAEAQLAPPITPPAPAKTLLGRARAVDGISRPRAAAEVRAEREAEERRLETARSKGPGVSRG